MATLDGVPNRIEPRGNLGIFVREAACVAGEKPYVAEAGLSNGHLA